jgi:hypothetical protein
MQKHLDIWSYLVILVTLVLFVAALFLKGFGHDLLLEAGVFLVSIKLIMMAYKNSVAASEVVGPLDGLQQALARVEQQTRTKAPGHEEVKTG